jgi:hypothetical protein
MDLYLPADYLNLREELDDWRDAPACRHAEAPQHERNAQQQNENVDPSWLTL